jgi:hypothetical protein
LKKKDDPGNDIPMSFVPFYDGAYVRYNSSIQNNEIDRYVDEYNEKSPHFKFKIKDFEFESNFLKFDTLKKYENIASFLSSLSLGENRKLMVKVDISYEILCNDTLLSITRNSEKIRQANKAEESTFVEKLTIKRRVKAQIDKNFRKVEKGLIEADDPDFLRLVNELNLSLKKIEEELDQSKARKYKTFKYFLSDDEAFSVRSKVLDTALKTRTVLLEHAHSMDSLENFMEESHLENLK